MIIRIRSTALGSSASLYAVGENSSLARQAAENTFLKLGWPAEWDKHGCLVHYPRGLMDRTGSAYVRATTWGDPYLADTISIGVYATNNPLVCLVKTGLHLKTGRWIQRKKSQQKQQDRANTFYQELVSEFGKLELRLVRAEDWTELVSKARMFRCSPFWQQMTDGSFWRSDIEKFTM